MNKRLQSKLLKLKVEECLHSSKSHDVKLFADRSQGDVRFEREAGKLVLRVMAELSDKKWWTLGIMIAIEES